MDKNKLHQQISKGTKAKLILEDPIVKEAFDYLFDQYRTEIFNTSYKDHEQRQVLWMAFNMLDKIKGHLVTVMETGKLASSELENLIRQSDNGSV